MNYYKFLAKKILKEVVDQKSTNYASKYYAFDWDDNLMKMPTQIYFKDEDGDVIGMSTEDFAEYRTLIGKPFDYEGHTIVGYDADPFRDFNVTGDRKFLEDIKHAPIASEEVWNDFKEAINNGSVIAIVTARGHSPAALKKAVKYIIENNMHGIEKSELVRHLKEYRRLAGLKQIENESWLINDYLDRCQFSPVSYGSGSASNPEEAKFNELLKFYNKMMRSSKKFQKAQFVNHVNTDKESIGGGLFKFIKPSFGFSDDDERNAQSVKKRFSDIGNKDLNIYLTKGGEKRLYEHRSSRRIF
jgi:hypothetical protein